MNSVMPQPSAAVSRSLVNWTTLIYGLHAFSIATGILTTATVIGAFLVGWPSIIAVILNYIKRDDARGTWLESHFRWQIRTFWFAFGWALLMGLFMITIVGIPIAMLGMLGAGAWVIYRVVRGWLALKDMKPIPR